MMRFQPRGLGPALGYTLSGRLRGIDGDYTPTTGGHDSDVAARFVTGGRTPMLSRGGTVDAMNPGRLLQEVATALVLRYLESQGALNVRLLEDEETAGVADVVYELEGSRRRARIKPDPYFGVDQGKAQDRQLIFYRADTGCYALEMVGNAATRSPGWVLTSTADEILYLLLALDQTAEEVAAVLARPGDPVANGLRVERSELHSIPLAQLRAWFEVTHERYPARPVTGGPTASWVRLVPRDDVLSAVEGTRVLGDVTGPIRTV